MGNTVGVNSSRTSPLPHPILKQQRAFPGHTLCRWAPLLGVLPKFRSFGLFHSLIFCSSSTFAHFNCSYYLGRVQIYTFREIHKVLWKINFLNLRISPSSNATIFLTFYLSFKMSPVATLQRDLGSPWPWHNYCKVSPLSHHWTVMPQLTNRC